MSSLRSFRLITGYSSISRSQTVFQTDTAPGPTPDSTHSAEEGASLSAKKLFRTVGFSFIEILSVAKYCVGVFITIGACSAKQNNTWDKVKKAALPFTLIIIHTAFCVLTWLWYKIKSFVWLALMDRCGAMN